MNIEIRIYKRYDMDLFALYDAGYPVTAMIRDAVTGFAHKQPVRFQISAPSFFNANEKKSFRTRFCVPDSDTETIFLIKSIKHGCRSNFCKAVLRDALARQNLAAYFSYSTDPSFYNGKKSGYSGYNNNEPLLVLPGSMRKGKTAKKTGDKVVAGVDSGKKAESKQDVLEERLTSGTGGDKPAVRQVSEPEVSDSVKTEPERVTNDGKTAGSAAGEESVKNETTDAGSPACVQKTMESVPAEESVPEAVTPESAPDPSDIPQSYEDAFDGPDDIMSSFMGIMDDD